MATNSIYLVLDMINDLVHEDGPNGKKGYGPILARRNTIANTAEALRKARAAGIRIGYVRVGFSPDYRECPPTSKIFQGAKRAGLFRLGNWGTEIHPALKPEAGDYDIVKHRVSPFYATSLEAILGANGVRRLYTSGVSTSGAVLSLAKEGHDRDYEIIVLEDCCAALTDEQHASVIEQMQRIATITTSRDVTFA
ncbi:MAG: chloramphenicol resistance protein [Betaproteobacteria bacterium RIFCSPLOWO2_02_64_14]|nr:MAG: chloramphenicol resistance protein [Betaproteobacteria bacterium RIFCSPLOWO2_02_64_14]